VSGIVEGAEEAGEKEGKWNLVEYQPGCRLTGKRVARAFGRMMRTSDGGRCM